MESAVSLGRAADGGGAEIPAFRQATVSDGTVATSYRLMGAGTPVVVLCGGDCPSEDLLLSALATRFRLLVPDLSVLADAGGEGVVTGRAFSVWLRGFLDGLGLGGVALVAGPTYALAVLGFTLVEYPRVTRVVMLVQDVADPAAPACAIREELVGVERPLLMVRLDDSAGTPPEIASEVIKFLSGGAE